ncbi:MAG: PIN domain-containing protein [Rhodoferax sp.]|nr:PIN domain-containing protein [Rhodoferax sp.]
MKFLLDTNTVSYFLRDYSVSLTNRLRACDPASLAISTITAGELSYGLAKLGISQRAGILSVKLNKLLRAVPVSPLNTQAVPHYATARTFLESQGTPIGSNDLWIAAHALAQNMTLVTNNTREFSRVPGLQFENWL